MPDEFDRLAHATFMRVLDADEADRSRVLVQLCGPDDRLLRKVRALMGAAERARGFLESPALRRSMPHAEPKGEPLPDAVGEYVVVGVLGGGGMATVYEAIQCRPRRRVALKVMHHGMTRAGGVERFRFETEVLARLQHPGIAQIYESGAALLGQREPTPFFAMELVPNALPITVYVERHDVPREQRLAMFLGVCEAVQHGHQLGVIHRDLKPANVLVDGQGRAKVIDFGIAKAIGADPHATTAVSDVNQLIGTLNYMSPEQCGAGSATDVRSDVYSLGVVLYQMCYGELPHVLEGLPLPLAIQTIVQGAVKLPARATDRRACDLWAIVAKAIEKNPARRYGSVLELSQDIRRFLQRRPIEARPAGRLDRALLFTQRHKPLVITASLAVLAVTVGAVVSTTLAVRLFGEVGERRAAEMQAAAERDVARWNEYVAQIASASAAAKTGEFEQLRARLATVADRPRGWEWGYLSRLAEPSVRTVTAHEDMIFDMAATADGERVFTAAGDGSVRAWDACSGERLASFQSESGAMINSVTYARGAGLVLTGDAEGVVRGHRPEDLVVVVEMGSLPGTVRRVAELPGGRTIAAYGEGEGWLWNTPLSAESSGEGFDWDQQGGVTGFELSEDGSVLASFNSEGVIHVRAASDLLTRVRLEYPGSVYQIRFSGDGSLLAAAGAGGRVLVWRVSDGTLVQDLSLTNGINGARSLAFDHSGRRLAVGLTRRIVICTLEDGRIVGEFDGLGEAVSGLRFSPDEQTLVSGSWDRTLRLWNVGELGAFIGGSILRGHRNHVFDVAFAPDGSFVASASRDGSVRLWEPDLAECFAEMKLGSGVTNIEVSSDGRRLAAGTQDGTVHVWDLASASIEHVLRGDSSGVGGLAFDAGGRRVAVGAVDGSVRVWSLDDPSRPRVLVGHTARVNGVRFSPSGELIATVSRDRNVRLWDADTGENVAALHGHTSDIFTVLFSEDGSRLYSGSRDQTVQVWDVATGQRLHVVQGHGQNVTSLALDPTGTRLAVGSWFGQVVLFDVRTLQLVLSIPAHASAVRGVSFSPDGRWLASASYDGTVRLSDSHTREQAGIARREAAARRERAEAWLREVSGESGVDPGTLVRRCVVAGRDPGNDPGIRNALLRKVFPPVSNGR